MRFLALLIPCVPLLAGCHKADARANTEMAQCMAAMGLEHGYLLYQTPPRYDLLAPLTAGITWYKHKLRVAGVPDQGRGESTAFANEHFHDREMIGKMVTACGHKLWADPEYRANFADLIRDGIAHDYACKPNPSRCTPHPDLQPPHPRHS